MPVDESVDYQRKLWNETEDEVLQQLRESGIENLKKWIQGGGVVIAWKNGGKWLSEKEITKVAYESDEEEETNV